MNKRQLQRRLAKAPPIGECAAAPSRRVIRQFKNICQALNARLAVADQNLRLSDNRLKYSQEQVSRLASELGKQAPADDVNLLFRAEAAEQRVAFLAKKLESLGVSPD